MTDKTIRREITRRRIDRLRNRLNNLEAVKPSALSDYRLWATQRNVLKNQIANLERQLVQGIVGT